MGLLIAALARNGGGQEADPDLRPSRFKLDETRRTITIDDAAVLTVPDNWVVSERRYANAVELITKGAAGTAERPEARTLVFVERRLDHAEAVRRLAEIASARKAETKYSSIAGWPAVQFRYREVLPEPSEHLGLPADKFEKPLPPEERMALHTATAIAFEDMVVRLETTVTPKADDARAREAEEIGRKAVLPPRNDEKATAGELTRLRARKRSGSAQPAPSQNGSAKALLATTAGAAPLEESQAGGVAPTLATAGGSSEMEAGVALDGPNMIVASNRGTSISNDDGLTFAATTATLPFSSRGDPSIAIGRSGNFYQSLIGLPGVIPPTGLAGLTGCAASVISSGNHGAVFAFAGNAALCPATGPGICFPDQPHIAADRANASTRGGDQLYAVWRNFAVTSATCFPVPSSIVTPHLSCSMDSGSNWSTPPVAIGGGDNPNVTVGQDGFVYVVMREGTDVMMHKFPSCNRGLTSEVTGFPTRVSDIADPTCPLPGLDRCHEGLIMPTAAVDDTNPAHVYVTVVKSASGSTANDDVLVIDSTNGGLTWRPPVTVNARVTARRFMPWICSAAGNAYVGWYDRRAAAAAGAASNDLTDFFLGSATIRNGGLEPDGELNLTGAPDPQCASGWPFSPADEADAEGCTVQPQLAGGCVNGAGGGSLTPCDFSSGPCPAGESCSTGGGLPKYGDYNGIACGRDRVLATWASATPPAGFTGTAPAGISVFADVRRVNGSLTNVVTSVPPNDPGRFDILADGTTVLSSVANATAAPLTLDVTAPHRVSVSARPGTSAADYSTFIEGDCDANGTVHFSALRPATCRITNLNRGYQQCINGCNNFRGRDRRECVQGCLHRPGTLRVVRRVLPAVDPGRFDVLIDGVVRRANAGSTTLAVSLTAGLHSVAESPAAGTSLGDYTTVIGGDCSPTGEVTLGVGQRRACEIVDTRRPGTDNAQLTIRKVLVPATDARRFTLLVNGTPRATNVGNGGTTGPLVLPQGTYVVSESGGGPAGSLIRTFSGDCNSTGTVVLPAGSNKTCTITNSREPHCRDCR
jgi:hypothetical protein